MQSLPRPKKENEIKRWMVQNDQQFLIFKGTDLVDAVQTNPAFTNAMHDLVAIYQGQRLRLSDGRSAELYSEETLQCIRQLLRTLLKDPDHQPFASLMLGALDEYEHGNS